MADTIDEVDLPSKHRVFLRTMLNKIALCLGTLHLSLMASLGIWVWCNPGAFGKVDHCAIDSASVVILGKSIPFRSPILRVWSLVIYAFFLAPVVNLIIPAGFFLAIFIAYHKWCPIDSVLFTETGLPAQSTTIISQETLDRRNTTKSYCCWPFFAFQRYAHHPRFSGIWTILPIIIGMIVLFVINVIFMVNTSTLR